MSLDTLLEAAKYIEYRSEAKARGEIPQDYQTFALQSKAVSAADDYRAQQQQQQSRQQQLFQHASRCDNNSSDSYSSNHFEDGKEKRRSGGAGTREVHNKLEKNRRAHLKECFETLKRQLPNMDDRKTSNLTILRGALRYITSLKRREREYEHEMERLAREKIAAQQRLAGLKKDLSLQLDYLDMSAILPDQDNETTTTASECGNYSDLDEELEAARDRHPARTCPSPTRSPNPKPTLAHLCDAAGNSENGKQVSSGSSIANVSNNKPVASTSSMTSLVTSYGGVQPSATTGTTVVVSSGVRVAPTQTVANTRGTFGAASPLSLANSKCATAVLAPGPGATNMAALVTSQQVGGTLLAKCLTGGTVGHGTCSTSQVSTTGLGLLSHAVTNSSAGAAVQVIANPLGGVKVLTGPAGSSSPSPNNGGPLVALTMAPSSSTLAPMTIAAPSSTLAAMVSSVPPKSLVRVTSGVNVGRTGGPGTTPVALVTAAQAKSLFLGPHGVAVTGSPVGGGMGAATTGVVHRRGLPQVLTPRALTTGTVLSGTAGALKQVRAGTAAGGQALSQLAAHVTHVAAASSPTAAVGQIPLMAPLSVVGHLPALLSQQFLSPGTNLGTLTNAASHHHHHHHHHHPHHSTGTAAVVKPLVVVSLPNVVAQPATPTSVGTAQ